MAIGASTLASAWPLFRNASSTRPCASQHVGGDGRVARCKLQGRAALGRDGAVQRDAAQAEHRAGLDADIDGDGRGRGFEGRRQRRVVHVPPSDADRDLGGVVAIAVQRRHQPAGIVPRPRHQREGADLRLLLQGEQVAAVAQRLVQRRLAGLGQLDRVGLRVRPSRAGRSHQGRREQGAVAEGGGTGHTTL